MDWQALAATSHYQTAVAIKENLQAGNLQAATTGIEELIEALARSDKRALKSQLIRLMKHIIKWKTQPEMRSRSWLASISNAREEIAEIQEETPSLSDKTILELWEKCFRAAQREAEAEMERSSQVQQLSWQEVFTEQYSLNLDS